MKTPDESAPVTPAKSTSQKLKPTNFPGLYQHENGTFYGKKKVAGVKKVFPLKTSAGENVYDRKIAEKALLAWSERQGVIVAATGGASKRTTFAMLLETYASVWSKKKKNTKRQYVWAEGLIKEGMSHLMGKPAENVTTLDCTKFLTALPKMKANSYNHVSRYLNCALAFGCDTGILAANVFEKVPKEIKRQKLLRQPPTSPTLEQFSAIVKNIDEEREGASAGYVEFLGLAALGEAEANSLQWRDIDFAAERINVTRMKTGKAFYVPFYPWLKPFLLSLKEKAEGAGTKTDSAARVFPHNRCRKALASACKRLGYPPFTPRNLRQMGIKRQLRAGLNFKLVAKYQGHSDGGVLIARVYSETISESDDAYERNAVAALK